MAVPFFVALSAAVARAEGDLPPGVILYRLPNAAPEGYTLLGAYTFVFPEYDATGKVLPSWLVFLARLWPEQRKQASALIRFEESQPVADGYVASKLMAYASRLAALKSPDDAEQIGRLE